MPKANVRRDKFYVGQRVILVLTAETQWERANGEEGVVVGPKVHGTWKCNNLEGTGPGGVNSGYRYTVRWSGGRHHFDEDMLKAAYDGDKAVSWTGFIRKTGLDVRQSPAITKGASHA